MKTHWKGLIALALLLCVLIWGAYVKSVDHPTSSASPNVASTPKVESTPSAVVHAGDIATVTDGLWWCGSTKEALDEIMKWGVRQDREEVARVMLRTRSAALTRGIQVKVLDSGGFLFSERKVRTLTEAKHGDPAFNPRVGMECWTVAEALTR